MLKYKRVELLVATTLLAISAIGALFLSGAATYYFFLSFGKVIAYSAVATIEVGIVGAVFSIRTKKEYEITGVTGWIVTLVSIILSLAVAMGANFLYKVSTLNIIISEQFINLTRIVTTTFIIPLVALLNVERLKIAVSLLFREEIVQLKEEPKRDTLPHDRVQYYIDRYGDANNVPVDEMAELFDRSTATIHRDLEKMRERMKGF